jgi:hypothetical protein
MKERKWRLGCPEAGMIETKNETKFRVKECYPKDYYMRPESAIEYYIDQYLCSMIRELLAVNFPFLILF